jgi:esterase/lipase
MRGGPSKYNARRDIVTNPVVPFQGVFDKRIPDKKAESIYQNRIEEDVKLNILAKSRTPPIRPGDACGR